MSDEHLSLQTGKHKCPCGQKASRLMRCAKCREVIARCGGCGQDMAQIQREHCKT